MKHLDIMERPKPVTLGREETQGFVEAVIVNFARY